MVEARPAFRPFCNNICKRSNIVSPFLRSTSLIWDYPSPPFISSAKFILRDNHNNPVPEDKIILNLTVGLNAPELEVVVSANTPVTSMPICVKDVWFEVIIGKKSRIIVGTESSVRYE